MIKENLKKDTYKIVVAAWTSTSVILNSSIPVFAENQITSHTPAEVSQRIFTANNGIATAFGGALIGIAVVTVGIKMLMTNKKQDARSEGMDSILTIILAATLIGGFAIFAGLIFGIGGGTTSAQ